MENCPTVARPSLNPDARRWTQILARYREPSHSRSIFEIAVTLGPLAGLWALGWTACYFGFWWLSVLLAVPAAGFLVRVFMIQHDCGQGAFFRHRLANDWVGRVIGVLTLTPYDFWRRTHAIHHASSGHLKRRGIGDVETLTVREYLARSFWGRLCYRTYRNPLVMFGLGPAYVFVLRQRLPIGMMRGGWQPWLSTMATNVAIAGIVATLIWCIGIRPFLIVHLPIILFAGSIGVWLFYVQHQFERTFWADDGEWTLHEAALYGSSHYDLPVTLRWFTANIGVHHVHHLCSRIPYYQLPRALRDYPELRGVSRLTFLESLRCARLVLWDEGRRRLISFREMRRQIEQDVIASIGCSHQDAKCEGSVRSIAAPTGRQTMALSFPNRSRFYDATRRAVRFWGYDSAMETSFFVTGDALKRIQPSMQFDEAGFLSAFDANRDRIYEIAAKVYARGRRGSYEIVGTDF